MAKEARNVTLEDRINRNKEKLGIENERLNVLGEELAEIRKKIEALKDMDAEKMRTTIVELEDEFVRHGKELGINIERQKVLVEELDELFKEMEIGDGDGE